MFSVGLPKALGERGEASRSQSLRKKCNRIVRSSGSKSISSSKSLLADFLVVEVVCRMNVVVVVVVV